MVRGKFVKKITSITMILVMVGLMGCGVAESEESKEVVEEVSEEVQVVEESAEQSEEIVEESAEEITDSQIQIPVVELETKTYESNEALEFVKNMKLGWNLGNTFDASNNNEYVEGDLSLESAWVGVKTTKEMIAAIKAAGFETIRIPVSWHNHVDEEF